LYDFNGSDRGMVRVYYGGETGYSLSANWTATGVDGGDQFGLSVANAGDVDNDGDDDLVVGAPRWGSTDFPDAGAAYLYEGSPTGLQASAAWTVNGGVVPGRFGNSVDGAGDVNGDGFADVVVGAPEFAFGPQERGGKAYLFLGSTNGLSTSFSWSAWGGTVGDAFG
jgi:hypothetical protein